MQAGTRKPQPYAHRSKIWVVDAIQSIRTTHQQPLCSASPSLSAATLYPAHSSGQRNFLFCSLWDRLYLPGRRNIPGSSKRFLDPRCLVYVSSLRSGMRFGATVRHPAGGFCRTNIHFPPTTLIGYRWLAPCWGWPTPDWWPFFFLCGFGLLVDTATYQGVDSPFTEFRVFLCQKIKEKKQIIGNLLFIWNSAHQLLK